MVSMVHGCVLPTWRTHLLSGVQVATLQATVVGNFSFTFVDLTLANLVEDGSTNLRYQGPKFTPSIFSIPRFLPTSEIYSALVAVWDIFCFYIAMYQAGYFLACIGPMNFRTEVPRASIFKHSPEPRQLWRTFLHLHAIEIAQNLLKHLRAIAIFAFTQLHSIWAACMLPLSSHCAHLVLMKKIGIFHRISSGRYRIFPEGKRGENPVKSRTKSGTITSITHKYHRHTTELKLGMICVSQCRQSS